MSRVSYKVTGAKAISDWLATVDREARKRVDDELSDIAAELEGDIVLSIQQGAKTGRIYKRKGVTHQASAPGQSPASDTGTLKKSIYSERARKLTYVVGSRIVYALHLEYGTTRMAARPFFRPSVEKMAKQITGRLEQAIKGAL